MGIDKVSKSSVDSFPLSKFDSEDAFNLGMLVREKVKQSQENAFIEVSSADGHCLFRCSSSCHTSTARDLHLELKKRLAMKYFKSHTDYIDRQSKSSIHFDQKPYEIPEDNVKKIGPGVIPIFLYNGDFPVGSIVICSGNHNFNENFATLSLQEFALKQKNEKQERKRKQYTQLLKKLKDEQEQEIAKQVQERLKLIEPPNKLEEDA